MKKLKDAYQNYFKIGAAVNTRNVRHYAPLLATHFNSLTCENEMKPERLYDKDGNFNFTDADTVYNFAVENDLAVRGHTLIWHNQTPAFFFKDGETKNITDAHMKSVAARYNKNVYAWDVVNEAVDDKSDAFLRKSPWSDALGEDYIAEVFAMAGRYFPDKDLYYNDYNETNPVKREKIAKLIKNLQARGLPVHGMGMQAHYNIFSPSLDEIKASLEWYAGLGVKISVTEMDVSVFRFDDHTAVSAMTAEMTEKQAEFYRQSFALFREYKEHIDSVTLWGVADDMTWLDNFPARGRKNWPLLFDENLEPKEAFWRVVEF